MAEKVKNMTELQERLKNLDLDLFDESIVKDNKIPFMHEKELCRVKMPNQRELALAKDYEDEIKIELSSKKSNVSRKKWKKILKKNQGIDIKKMDKQKDDIVKEIKEAYLSLAGTKDIEKKRIDLFVSKIEDFKDQLTEISLEIVQHMAPCIENKVEVAYIKYLTFCCTEKDNNGNWENVWESWESFEKDRTDLPMYAKLYFSRLYLSTRV